MPLSRNIALTVHELEVGEFYWVLMEEAADGDQPGNERHVYEPLEAAHEPYASYSNALVAGVAVMRRLFGTDGKPVHDARRSALSTGRSL
ncbi:hypothetical protein [Variovorax sp. 770b2]|jgi:hypothetical protein|uniref:hypothetical protein n=1 Tax=Variovorax sp. 770b2 TaxID=1566271 RepID=UPI0008EE7DA3|nr:hypothetical protein [Variovorax sp. 770b2]SFP23344.1 hypothetical protein SAMN03159339_1118 [Variovorax sp. 770b2]